MILTMKEAVKHLKGHYFVATSGGFDPLHIGHLRCFEASARYGILLVIVNSDNFLRHKKGGAFMRLNERMEIVNALKCVQYVVPWDDGTQTVSGALKLLKPKYFAKGGDRDSLDKIPEAAICEKIGCKVVLNVGGPKIQSSQALLSKW